MEDRNSLGCTYDDESPCYKSLVFPNSAKWMLRRHSCFRGCCQFVDHLPFIDCAVKGYRSVETMWDRILSHAKAPADLP
jgi:hypothetical protein